MKRFVLVCVVFFLGAHTCRPAPVPIPRIREMEGEVTSVSEGPGDHVGICLNWEHWFTVTKRTNSEWQKESVVGGFLIHGTGSGKLIAKVRYSSVSHVHWGLRMHYAKSIVYRRVQ
jgi:hypothetical protein